MRDFDIRDFHNELTSLESIEGLLGLAIVRKDGILNSALLPRDIDDRKFAAMVATMFGGLNAAIAPLKKEKLQILTVEYDQYQVIAMEINDKFIIVSLLDINTDYGLVLIELEDFIRKIKNLI
ncbi:MAG: roadblock/LC7 domain-containing protein [Promethearchaeota archaeon]